jgi:2-polyprenyl-6-methoxyphenol hydroxylase-like FAD-dependent oxidoreductase
MRQIPARADFARLEEQMRCVDVAIVGGGLAGSTAAAMLGRAGFSAVLIDLHQTYPADFRSEKIVDSQIPLLHRTGLGDAVLSAATADEAVTIARFGGVVETRRHSQYNILYDRLVNAVRSAIPLGTEFIHAKVTSIDLGADRQRLVLSSGSEIFARLVILANGLNTGLRQNLSMRAEILSKCHSISAGFNVTPIDRSDFDFRSLTYYSERPASRIAYLTLFLIQSTMRANLFFYRDMQDPWLRQLHEAPVETLFTALPNLRSLTGNIEVTGAVKIRPVDLYLTENYRQAGIVLVGDAFSTSCPAAGTGVHKVFTDVERLCHLYVPRWLATPGMGRDKISAFYEDPIKTACDQQSLARAFYMRSLSIDPRLAWRTRRLSRYAAQRSIALLRRTARQWSPLNAPGNTLRFARPADGHSS